MNDFSFQSPTRFVFGRGFCDRCGEELATLGAKRVLLVFGGGSVRHTGTLARVEASLAAAGIECVELGGVRPNPELGLVRKGVSLARERDVDLVLAVGGGSVIDCAKAIAFGVPYEGDVWDFFSGKASITSCLPIASVLTIPAAGSEASASCVISNDALSLKRGCAGEVFRPKLAIMDPTLTFTLPAYQTAAGATDIICHICERFFSSAGPVPVTDSISCALIRTVMDAASAALENPDDYDARANIMWAGTLAHNDLCSCGRSASYGKRAGGWESHGLEHEISAHHPQVAHGAGLAVILPAWMRHVWRSDVERFLSFAEGVFGLAPADETNEEAERCVERAIDCLQAFLVGMGMPATLTDLDLSPADVDAWIETLSQNKGESFGELQTLTMDDARAIYLSAF